MASPHKVLIIGDDTRSFLATVRSLGRKGIEVHAAPFSMRAPALSSKYIRQVHRLPYYLDGGADWLAAMQKLMLDEQFELIIPCEERSLLPLYKHQHDLPGTCALAIPSQPALDAFFDKLNTRQLASEMGVPVAKGRLLLATDTVDGLLDYLTLPIIAKQRQSYSWPELYVRTSVKIISSRSELDSFLCSLDKGSSHIFFEEMFPGRGLGVSVLCRQGVVLQAFEHHRVHELSGSSYYRKSAPLDAGRLAAVASMVKAVAYTGVAMFEFKLNEASGDWILLEVNARPWGSLPLPVAAGVDFPYLLYQMVVKNEVPPQRTYKSRIYGRNLIPDLWQLRAQLQSLSPRRGSQIAHFIGWMSEFGRVLIGREHLDAMVLDDMRPGWVEMQQFFAEHFGARFGGEKSHRSDDAPSLVARVKAAQASAKPVRIVFVCQGNICRSPYAEIKAQQLFDGLGEKLIFSSAGLLPRNQRPSPSVAIEAAQLHGVDMRQHLSQYASELLMREATAILIFDKINLSTFESRYQDLIQKVYFIGELSQNGGPIEILDPEGTDLKRFDETYTRIDKLLSRLVNEITDI